MRILVFLAAVCTLAACGNSSGATPATGDDSTGGDSQISGTDAVSDVVSGTDALADVPSTGCTPTYTGAIPGATLDLSNTPCTFSISAAKGVFNLPYIVKISGSETLSMDGLWGGCQVAATNVHGGIATAESIGDGASQKWCMCDVGLCAPTTSPFVATTVGAYPVAFSWDGKNWNGPSDTGNQPGAAFAPGMYTFTVSLTGKRQAADGATQPFAASASLPIKLTP